MSNLIAIDFHTRARAHFACCRCSAPTAIQGVCAQCADRIAAEARENDVRRARECNANNKCPGCLVDIDARTLLAVIPGKAIALCLECGFGGDR